MPVFPFSVSRSLIDRQSTRFQSFARTRDEDLAMWRLAKRSLAYRRKEERSRSSFPPPREMTDVCDAPVSAVVSTAFLSLSLSLFLSLSLSLCHICAPNLTVQSTLDSTVSPASSCDSPRFLNKRRIAGPKVSHALVCLTFEKADTCRNRLVENVADLF